MTLLIQYASIRNKYPSSAFSATLEGGGALGSSGSIILYVQGHNRAGLNKLSDPVTLNYTSSQKIVITLNSTIRKNGEDLHKIVVSAKLVSQGTSVICQIAEWAAKSTDQTSNISLPATIQINHPQHLILSGIVSTFSDLPQGPALLHGMVRQLIADGKIYRYDQDVASGSFAAVGASGYWVEEPKGMYRNINTTESLYGSDRSIDVANLLIPPPPKSTIESTPIRYWWRNGLNNTSGNVVAQGSRLSLQFAVNQSFEDARGISYNNIFSGLVMVRLIGYVDIASGELIEEIESGEWLAWNSRNSPMILPAPLGVGEAAVWDVKLKFAQEQIRSSLDFNSQISYSLSPDPLSSQPSTLGSVLGSVVLSEGGRLRILPNDLMLSGTAIIGSQEAGYFEVTKTTPTILTGIAADTPLQKVVINATTGDPYVRASDYTVQESTEALRATIGTKSGLGAYTSDKLVSVFPSSDITLVISHPVVRPGEEFTRVRANYPDLIKGNSEATFIAPYFKIFMEVFGQSLESIPYPVLQEVTQEVAIVIGGSDYSEHITLPEEDEAFGLFTPTIDVIATDGAEEEEPYTIVVKIAYYYPSPNYFFTTIDHETAGIPEVDTTLGDVLNDATSDYWKAPVTDLDALKELPSSSLEAGEVHLVKSKNAIYWFDPTSDTEDDDESVIAPSSLGGGNGRFLKVGSEAGGSTDLPIDAKGDLLSHDGSALIKLSLPSSTAGLVLTSAPETESGLAWLEPSGGGSEGEITDDPNSVAYFNSEGILESLNVPEAPSILVGANENSPQWVEYPYYEGLGGQIAYHDGNNWTALDAGSPDQYLGISSSHYPQWQTLSVQLLSDSYGSGVLVDDLSVFTYDLINLKWIPYDKGLPYLTQLLDVDVTNVNGQALIKDAATNKFILGHPDYSVIQGVVKDIGVEAITGDADWEDVIIYLSARKPFVNLKTNAPIQNRKVALSEDSPYLDGSTSYLFNKASSTHLTIPSNTGNLLGALDFTLELWFKLDNLPSGEAIAILYSRTNQTTQTECELFLSPVGVSDYKVKFWAYDNTEEIFNGDLTSTTSINANNWYYVAITRSSDTWKLFLDGVLEHTLTASGSMRTSWTNLIGTPISIGKRIKGNTTGIDGKIEDLRLTKGLSRYSATFTPPEQPNPSYTDYSRATADYGIVIQQAQDFDDSIEPEDGYKLTYSSVNNKIYWAEDTGGAGGGGISSLSEADDYDDSSVATNDQVMTFRDSDSKWYAKTFVSVQLVNGFDGEVVLTTDDIEEGDDNKYFDDSLVATYLSTSPISILLDTAEADDGQLAAWNDSISKWVPINPPAGGSGGLDETAVNTLIDAAIDILTTTDIEEGVNEYYTDAKVDARITLAGSGSGLDETEVNALIDAALAILTTDDITEATNEYYTDAKVNAIIATLNTDDITEGTNEYYTNAKVDARIALAGSSSATAIEDTWLFT